MSCFEHFSANLGVKANMDKSSFYVAGVTPQFKEQMLNRLHFSSYTLAFKYLGVPISSNKLTISQCMPLVDKIVSRINCWTSRFHSYACKLQLIKSILFEMQTQWNEGNWNLQKFLWHGTKENSQKNPLLRGYFANLDPYEV